VTLANMVNMLFKRKLREVLSLFMTLWTAKIVKCVTAAVV